MQTLGITIPFYSNVSYLRALLKSLLLQTDANWEALIIDDSEAGFLSKCEIDELADQRISLVSNERNIGAVNSWNLGLEILLDRNRYKLVSVIHGDDVLGAKYVECAHEYQRKYPNCEILHVRSSIIGPTGRHKISIADLYKSFFGRGLVRGNLVSFGDLGLATILKRNFIYCPALIFQADRIENLNFDKRWEMVADLDLTSRMLISGKTILTIPSKEYFYRRHGDSLSSRLTKSTTRFVEEIELYRRLETVCKREGFTRSAREARRKTSIKLHLLFRIIVQLLSLRVRGLSSLLRLFRKCW